MCRVNTVSFQRGTEGFGPILARIRGGGLGCWADSGPDPGGGQAVPVTWRFTGHSSRYMVDCLIGHTDQTTKYAGANVR